MSGGGTIRAADLVTVPSRGAAPRFELLAADDLPSLEWRMPEWVGHDWILVSAARCFARLRCLGERDWKVIVESATGVVALDLEPTWRDPTLAVRSRDARLEHARLLLDRGFRAYNGADLTTADGTTARWELSSVLFGTRAHWRDSSGSLLIEYRGGSTAPFSIGKLLRTECRVRVTPAGFAHPQRDVMLWTGWYLALRSIRYSQ